MSHFGASRGVPEYDDFRTMAAGKRYRRRGTVLGLWNQLKREMWLQLTGQRL